ncbi:MAG: zinc ribbon domain-containing protein [Candidatus Thorarchaeota archaeon]
MRPKNVQRVLLDLRAKGVVQYSFNSETGVIILGKTITYTQAHEYFPPNKKLEAPISTAGKIFCVYCGHKIEISENFCPNCGSKL